MSLMSRFVETVRSWATRRRRGGAKPARRAGVAMEQLDHRQLLSVNFTGNVATDFPGTPAKPNPGVVILPDNPAVIHPAFPAQNPTLKSLVKVSGFDIQELRVTYTPQDDVLSIGIGQPASQQPGRETQPVIAGDSDNNGNDGTVDPLVTAASSPRPFLDSPDFGGQEYMGVSLDLRGTNKADVVAGYDIADPRSPKQFQVADAVVDPADGPNVPPVFGRPLPQFTGNVYKVNSPAHPNLEFAINNFSKLYLQETGKPLMPDSVIRLGAFAGSDQDALGEARFPAQGFKIIQAIPPAPPPCPPASPPILVNYHQNNHINTAHDTAVRASVLGSSGFDVRKIIPSTVRLGGATPVDSFDRFINRDGWLDATFVFRGTDIKLPPGFTNATLTGQLTDGTSFSSTVKVFNRDRSFYTPQENAAQVQRQLDRDTRRNGFTVVTPKDVAPAAPLAVDRATRQNGFTVLNAPAPAAPVVNAAPAAPAASVTALSVPAGPRAAVRSRKPDAPQAPPVVSIPKRQPVVVAPQAAPVVSIPKDRPASPALDAARGPKVSARMQRNIDAMVRDLGAMDMTPHTAGSA